MSEVLILHPGPIYDLEEYWGRRLRVMSEYTAGSVITRGEAPQEVAFGNYAVTAIRHRPRLELVASAQFLFAALMAARRRSTAGSPIDLVVTYDPLKTGLIGWVVKLLFRARLVVEVNGDYTAAANYAEISNPLLRRLKRTFFTRVASFVLSRADGIKILYPGQLEPFAEVVGDTEVNVLFDSVDLSGFRNLGETPQVLFVGFPFHLKGVDVLIDAFKRVSARHPAWELTILGHFPDRTELNAAIDGHPRIAHHPPVPHKEVARHIGRCGILVLPSRMEAMGRVLLEAMACAKPRIATNVGGIPTVIEDGHDGILVEPGDVEGLARALDLLMSDPDLRRRLGEAAHDRMPEFSMEQYAKRLWGFWSRVLASGAHPDRQVEEA